MICTVDEGEFDWMAACMVIEEQHRRWSNHSEEMNHYFLSADEFVVDAVHVLQVFT